MPDEPSGVVAVVGTIVVYVAAICIVGYGLLKLGGTILAALT